MLHFTPKMWPEMGRGKDIWEASSCKDKMVTRCIGNVLVCQRCAEPDLIAMRSIPIGCLKGDKVRTLCTLQKLRCVVIGTDVVMMKVTHLPHMYGHKWHWPDCWGECSTRPLERQSWSHKSAFAAKVHKLLHTTCATILCQGCLHSTPIMATWIGKQ